MPADTAHIRRHLVNYDFRTLFIEELGWDRHRERLDVDAEGTTYVLEAVAHKRGVVVFACEVDDSLPSSAVLVRIEKQVTKARYEHLIVYYTRSRNVQIWQHARREAGRPTYRTHRLTRGQTGEALAQRLAQLEFSFHDEPDLALPGVLQRFTTLDVETRITRRFYDEFQREHTAFLGFIQGIGERADREWYASLMLNRLMFVYFIQKKGFLDGDRDYLSNRLQRLQATRGDGHFLSFYRAFLRRLFHEGFSQQKETRPQELEALIGDVPYLNGGLFELHHLETIYGAIEIDDEAFVQLFAFFDEYQWHLDTRPLRDDHEINPDVLGYIFEKYINQKEMGAYYTKEDVTEYIAKNTVVPYVLHEAERQCRVAFTPGGPLWGLMQGDPDRYLYAAIRHGIDSALPDDIAAGIPDVSKRAGWNRPASSEYALRTETWREHIARRTRSLALRRRLAAGEIHLVDDLVTLNLDIRQFAQDAIEQCEGPDALMAFWRAIRDVTVLDPTCGSGAFLFAALNVLQPLYEACLDRMQDFLSEWRATDTRHHPNYTREFEMVLAQIQAHPNRDYFILKSIVVNNLYGVDIMKEAAEICKLRLFLKLVAQVDDVADLEPLPDVDFNIRAGNTLVGFTSRDEIVASRQGLAGTTQLRMALDDSLTAIDDALDELDIISRQFRLQQTELGGTVTAADKARLMTKLHALSDKLDRMLAGEYGISPNASRRPEAYERLLNSWRDTHQPMHWIAEFHGVMSAGGFDVVIGNPPYIERAKFTASYLPLNLYTLDARDIYAWFVERSVYLTSANGRMGLIIPVSVSSSRSFAPLRNVIHDGSSILWLSHFANRPGQLFEGAQNRLSILLRGNTPPRGGRVLSTRYHRWDTRNGERALLFPLLQYADIGDLSPLYGDTFPKVGDHHGIQILRTLGSADRKPLHLRTSRRGTHPVYWVRVPGYFCQFFRRPPQATDLNTGNVRIRGETLNATFEDELWRSLAHAALNSTLFYVYFTSCTDGRHINPSDVRDFPLADMNPAARDAARLVQLSSSLDDCMAEHVSHRTKSGLSIESVSSANCKTVIDLIDCSLASHYGLDDATLDYIVNYEYKYRLSAAEDS